MKQQNWYAAQSPRGFANEIRVYRFFTREARDAWHEEHKHDGDCNSAALGAYIITAREAARILGCRGDAITQCFNSEGVA